MWKKKKLKSTEGQNLVPILAPIFAPILALFKDSYSAEYSAEYSVKMAEYSVFGRNQFFLFRSYTTCKFDHQALKTLQIGDFYLEMLKIFKFSRNQY